MSPEQIGLIGIIAILVLFFLKIPVAITLIIVSLIGTTIIRGWDVAFAQLGRTPFDTSSAYSLSVIPLFILMGMVLSNTGIGKDLYRVVDSWIGHLRGGLAMATIGTAAIFSSISGSLNATTATVAKIALPEMEKYKYKSGLSTASVAAGGTLGILIPPSVILILYGILTREPIGALLISGIIPGVLQILLFVITVAILVRRDPSIAPPRELKADNSERINNLKNIWAFAVLFFITIGGIYLGVFTPTEAAGVGAFGALVVALISRKLKWQNLKDALEETVRLTAFIFLILMGANLFGQFLAISRIPVVLTSFFANLDMNPYLILIGILAVLLVLGCFIDGMALMVITLPILYPIITELGFNGIWFGVIMIMVINLGALTPPLGISVYVIKGVAKNVSLQTIFKGVVPMIIAMIVCVGILIVFPQLVTILPDLMK
ncbi:TRAP transporter large permease [Bacilli bacterium]|nr:C4-dicarboxylate ABC transporter permease [Bacilli bacterium VT-13-104]PZD84250.1 TRAP transporter large permease [Bacilli bacterium]PZD85067.1 TRAP transporter large permease [Bacilli bacterium]PZD88567.1 TRAP transporter large permease [Bacilli bacterium]RCO05165.1 TRAP transporter large permease [Bacilli bacterium]